VVKIAIIKIDLEGVSEGREWPVLDAGTYLAKIVSIESGKSKAGNPMLTWTFSVSDHPGTLRMWTALDAKSLWKIKGIFSNLGYSVDGELDVDTDELVGREVAIEVTVGDWNGSPTNNVDDVKDAAAAGTDNWG
jgi:hypothetical protein